MEDAQPDREDVHPDRALTQARERAVALACRHLNRRERTVHEMREHLERRGCAAAETEYAIALLLEQGLLDDGRYVRLFVEDKRTLEQWGADRIARALRARGIDRELVQEVLAEEPRDGEVERATVVLRRRFPTPPRDPRDRERALGVLVRKGFDSELALEAIRAYTIAPACSQ